MTTRTTGKSAYSIMVMLQLPKLATGVRFPLGALGRRSPSWPGQLGKDLHQPIHGPFCLGQQRLDDPPVNICQTMMPPLVLERQAAVVDAQAIQQCRIQIVDVNPVLGDVVAEVVGGSVSGPRANTAAGHPDRKTSRVVVAAVAG